jgi:hypothetical protein
MRVLVGGVACVVILASGCGYERIGPAFGRADREAMAMQQPPLPKTVPPPSMALDTQEAQVIAETYVRSLSGKAKAEPEPVLYVAPPSSRQATAPMLPPSVPKN